MKRENLKVGMKVRIRKDAKDIRSRLTLNESMEDYLGTVVTITRIDSDGDIQVNDAPWYWDIKWLEYVDFNKSLITDGCRITLDNGDQLIYLENKDTFIDTKRSSYNSVIKMDDVNQDGTTDGDNYIVKIEYPKYATVYEKSEVKEMTLKEVCDALGYEVKIKKEN